MELKNKKVLVVGFERTGEAVVNFLLSKGAKVTVSEIRREEELKKDIQKWKEKGVKFEFGEHREKTFLNTELIILSPGVPPFFLINKAQEMGIDVISEVELAFNYLKGKLIGITGSNGKSTTVTLIYEILKRAKRNIYMAGNIGFPLISYATSSLEDDIFVVELSSFQLKFIKKLKPYISVVLNVTPDHLDWHADFNDYFESKKKIFLNQKKDNFAIINADDSYLWPLRDKIKAKVFPFSRKTKLRNGAYVEKNSIIIKNYINLDISKIKIKGLHNQENIMASVLVAYILKISPNIVEEVIYKFKGLEHRLEKVTEFDGIEFYNDSKATNVDATLKSIQSFDQPIILIMGGRDKHGEFEKLRSEIKKRVKKLILIGEAKDKIRKSLEGTAPYQYVDSLKEAVEESFFSAEKGDIVLLAPACASFDMFRNFEHRGKVFKKEVLRLKKERDVQTF